MNNNIKLPPAIGIVGIHTGIGKTIVATVIAEALGADYWKPVQAGLEERDTAVLSSLLSMGAERVHAEAIQLTQPLSPHEAAAIDGVVVDYKNFAWPVTDKPLVVETAGGVLSPISADSTMADFVQHYKLPVLLVVQHYLGSINHTLLCIEVLKSRGIELLGIIINGSHNEASESFICAYSGVGIAGRVPQFETVDKQAIINCAAGIKSSLLESIANGTKH